LSCRLRIVNGSSRNSNLNEGLDAAAGSHRARRPRSRRPRGSRPRQTARRPPTKCRRLRQASFVARRLIVIDYCLALPAGPQNFRKQIVVQFEPKSRGRFVKSGGHPPLVAFVSIRDIVLRSHPRRTSFPATSYFWFGEEKGRKDQWRHSRGDDR
jgi:hypothetical protein